MVNVVGVRFRGAGKLSYFDPLDLEVKAGTHVIVETGKGVEYGTVAASPRQIEDDKVPSPLYSLLRIATPEDEEHMRLNREKEREALRICKEKVRAHNLEMKLIDAEYTFDNNKILFYFTADGRVDFRELVKDLAGVFRTRIELRQIGVRDETKLLGGIGICGRPLCCQTYLSEFAPVSIRMAKEQNLSLNPTKISGVCGRLMCCLKNEEATYAYLNSHLPYMGETVQTVTGLRGEVSEINVLRQKVKVIVEIDGQKEVQEYHVDELKFRGKKGQAGGRKEADGEETAQDEAARDHRAARNEQGSGRRAEPKEPKSGEMKNRDRRSKGPRRDYSQSDNTAAEKGRGRRDNTASASGSAGESGRRYRERSQQDGRPRPHQKNRGQSQGSGGQTDGGQSDTPA